MSEKFCLSSSSLAKSLKIEVNNLTAGSISEKFLKRVAKKILRGENIKKGSLSIALVRENQIKELNKKYLRKNRATDVLSFGGNPDFLLKSRQKIGKKGLNSNLEFRFQEIGEVVICPQKIRKNAKKYSVTFEKELARVLIHGILHLLGYNHEKTIAEAEKMKKKENYYLSQIFK